MSDIRSKPPSKAYDIGWERCFGRRDPARAAAIDANAAAQRIAQATQQLAAHMLHEADVEGCPFCGGPRMTFNEALAAALDSPVRLGEGR